VSQGLGLVLSRQGLGLGRQGLCLGLESQIIGRGIVKTKTMVTCVTFQVSATSAVGYNFGIFS